MKWLIWNLKLNSATELNTANKGYDPLKIENAKSNLDTLKGKLNDADVQLTKLKTGITPDVETATHQAKSPQVIKIGHRPLLNMHRISMILTT